jgi:hypothetical protein
LVFGEIRARSLAAVGEAGFDRLGELAVITGGRGLLAGDILDIKPNVDLERLQLLSDLNGKWQISKLM